MNPLNSPALLALLLSLAIFCSAANAADCSTSEYQSVEDLYDAAATTDACSPYSSTSAVLVSLYAPCSATDCVAVMTQLAADLPDCEYYGVNEKTILSDSLEICTDDSTTTDSTTSVETSAPDSSTTTTPPPTSSSTTDCTADESQSVEDMYDAAAATDACSPYASTSSLLVSIAGPCSATDCVDVMTQLAYDLPDCLYEGANEKAELTDSLSLCTDDTTSEVDSSTPFATSASASTPASTASSTSCTTTEVKDMWDVYVNTAKSDECAADSTINGYSIFIFTLCDSDCADKIKDLAEQLPNCYYDYDFENKKQDVLDELENCAEYSTYVSVTMYPDSSIEFASTPSSATSDADTSTVSSDGSTVFANGDPSDTALDSSATGVEGSSSSTASPRVSTSKLRLWGISTLLAGAFLVL